MACLWAMTVWIAVIVARVRSRSSTRRSPIPPTTPTPTSDTVVMMETMAKMHSDSMKLVVDLTQGRESPQTNGSQETWPTLNERPSEYDYDSTPLSPGIEAVLAREEQETEQARLLREREELQRTLIEKQSELERLNLEQSSPGPWDQGEQS